MKNNNQKVLFLYDEMMTKSVQELTHIPIKFLSFGYIRAKMYWLNDTKKRRYFATPPVSKFKSRLYNTFIYGGVFVINDFPEYERSLYSYYNSSISFTGEIMQEDLYYPENYQITPITFNSIKEFENCTYKSLDTIEGLVMLGHLSNPKVKNSVTKNYYRHNVGIDVPSFLTMLKEHPSGR